jgi:hypothetical protein
VRSVIIPKRKRVEMTDVERMINSEYRISGADTNTRGKDAKGAHLPLHSW